MYGLKQAQKSWAEVFNNFLDKFGFKQSTSDPCMYIYEEKNEKMYLALYVNDELVTVTSNILVDKFLDSLSKDFEMTTTKDMNSFLGAEISILNWLNFC